VNLRATISQYRWPIYLGGILTMSVMAQGTLVYVATRPDVALPMRDYYQRSLEWDADAAVLAASRQLGWAVRFRVPTDAPHLPGSPRPVDILIHDRDGQPVLGLQGSLQALRPADSRLNQSGALTEIPHLPGTYRTLLRLDQPGLWDFRLEARRDALRFLHSARVSLAAATPASGAAAQ